MKDDKRNTDVGALYEERENLLRWLNPPAPDPTVWPPEGWELHTTPGYVYRVMKEEDLRTELFGSPEKTEWLKNAKRRVLEITKELVRHFYGKPKAEGTQRVKKEGFAVCVKTALTRKLDADALRDITKKRKSTAAAITWEPKLILKEFRKLSEEDQKALSEGFTERASPMTLDIVPIED